MWRLDLGECRLWGRDLAAELRIGKRDRESERRKEARLLWRNKSRMVLEKDNSAWMQRIRQACTCSIHVARFEGSRAETVTGERSSLKANRGIQASDLLDRITIDIGIQFSQVSASLLCPRFS